MNLRSPNPEENRVPFAGVESFFAGWKQSLAQSGLREETEAGYRRGLEAYSAFCRCKRLPVKVETARQFVTETKHLLPATVELWKEALNWYFRLTELLRLRIKDVDLARRQVTVRAGKGKDRMTVLPERLVEPLRAHRDRVRELYEADRTAKLAGVWMPESLERKYPSAGVSWEWHWLFPSRQLLLDPRSGLRRRHHVLDATFQHAIRLGTRRAGLHKRVTPHTLSIRLQHICLRAGRIFAPCRICWGMWMWRPRKSTPT